MRIDDDEDYNKAVDNYVLENEDILKETYGRRWIEEGKVEFSYMSEEEKLNFLY